jgi:granule-bound starch synthase
VHNAAFQGRFPRAAASVLGLPASSMARFEFQDGDPRQPGDGGAAVAPPGARYAKLNWMKAGASAADRVITVSPSYAEELKASPSGGVELDDVFRGVGVEGIVNGVDPAVWGPALDKYIPLKYDASTVAAGKAAAKASLQAELGLAVAPAAPLVAFVGRLEEQKGVDVLLASIPALVAAGVQVAVLGTGKTALEARVGELAAAHPGGAAGVAKFDTPLAHKLFAGADFVCVPSRFEPCGIVQLQAMAYGAVPVVASVGGLLDTVKEGATGFQVGRFESADAATPGDVAALTDTLLRAAASYGTPAFTAMRAKCIGTDVSWDGPATAWEGVIAEVIVGGARAAPATAAKEAVKTPAQAA